MVDYNTRQRKRNMVVGGFVIVAFCLFIWLIFIFGELPVAVSQFRSFRVLVNFPDAPGIQENTPVKYCGYQVGRVIGVSPPFLFEEPGTGRRYHQVKVTLAIDRKYTSIPDNVDVVLIRRGLGSSYIEFQFDPNRKIAKFLHDEAVLQGMMGTTSEFFPKEVQQKIEDLVDAISILANSANQIVSDQENQQNIKDAIANVKVATQQATRTMQAIETTSQNASRRIDETAEKAGGALDSIKTFSDTGTAKVDDVAERLSGAIAEIRQILAKVNEGEGSAGKVLNDGRLYENLLDSSQELQMALEQLKSLAAEARDKGIKIKL
jgi:phospholipid/cholesterol/gamma-HCH transport system substrate-binding protein